MICKAPIFSKQVLSGADKCFNYSNAQFWLAGFDPRKCNFVDVEFRV